METYKKGISLIVLVITIIVLSILATTVIISISNGNVISEAKNSVDKYNLKQIETNIQLEKSSMMLENGGKEKDLFELIESSYSKGIINAEQRREMIANGGELVIGEEMLRLDVNSIVYYDKSELVSTEAPYSIRFKFITNSLPDDVVFTEAGFLFSRETILDSRYPEVPAEKKFKLDAKEKYGIAIVKGIKSDHDMSVNKNTLNALFYSIPENMLYDINVGRAYIKYTYDGIDGIIYSDIVRTSVNSLK